ncbi:MobF family relaxase [Nocardia suismassiliense]|uniref:MobF family relaxase n=1 Tax=Nocardia suismassiliense TaxID=2077092 RepID=UPI000D1F13FC|nr:MobF family relaxase [Nocardia suismassiliense]
MMTLHVVHRGDGYAYLSKSVAVGDVDFGAQPDFSGFYDLTGTPPGEWFGRGAAAMGVSGQVSAAQMRALFGAGMHPNADELIGAALAEGLPADKALAAGRIGSPFYSLRASKTRIGRLHQQLVGAFTESNLRAPTRQEWSRLRGLAARQFLTETTGGIPTGQQVQTALAGEGRQTRKPVTCLDCVFTAPKSVAGFVFGLGSPSAREIAWQAHMESIREVLAYAEPTLALARRGRGGARKIDTAGWTVALYTHFDNRCGDPNLHTHAVISAKVLGADGKWSCLDARALHAAASMLSCRYNATIMGKLSRRLGVRIEERSRGRGKKPVLEIAGVPQGLNDEFSRRRPEIQTATEELVAAYIRRHGRSPSKAMQIRLADKATMATRGGKPLPRTLTEMLAEWDSRATAWLNSVGDDRSASRFVADLLDEPGSDQPRPFRPDSAALAAGLAAGSAAVQARELAPLRTAIDAELDRYHFPTARQRGIAGEQMLHLLDPHNRDGVTAQVVDREIAEERARFDATVIAQEVVETVARRRATWTESHIRAAVEDRLGICVFDSDHAQRAAVEQVVAMVRDQRSICLSIDPDPVPTALQRSSGESQFDGPALTTVRYTSEAVLAAEARLQQASCEPSPEFVTSTEVSAAIAKVEHAESTTQNIMRRLTIGQRRVVEHLCTTGTRLAVAVGPAGAGKTTALAAVVAAWRDAGRTVIALSPQKSAARELSAKIGIRADTIAALLWAHKVGTAAPIPRGSMILIDEAAMAATADLDAIQQLAETAGAVVRWVGDPWQLSAVEAGGALRLVCADTRAPELDTVVRFADPDEAAASLHVRNGDPNRAWEFYADRGRVQSGLTSDLRTRMLAAHMRDLDEGVSSLMMAATVEDVYRLNGAAQSAYAERGVVDRTGACARLSDGHHGYVGDIIVTRRNQGKLRILGGPRGGGPVTNGDRWRVIAVHSDGSLTVAGAEHCGRVRLPAWYVTADVELGYACTVHRAQGVTVDRAHLLMGTSLGRALAYVGLSRGRLWNGLYLSTDTLPDPPPLEHEPDEPVSAAEVFASVCAREDDNIAATEVMRTEQARIEDPVRLAEIYTRACQLLGRGHVDRLVDRALPTVLYRQVRDAEAFDALADTITGAGQLGVSAGELIRAIVTNDGADEDGHSLLTARDAAALLCARADGQLAPYLAAAQHAVPSVRDLVFSAVAPLPPRYPGVDIELADYAGRLRARLLGELPADPPPAPRPGAGFGSAPDPDIGTDRRSRLLADYNYYAHQLCLDHARYLLDRALPAVVARQLASGASWARLLETIALTHWHGLDPNRLVADITRGDLLVLLHARDAAALLCERADIWLAAHLGVTAAAEPPLVSVTAAPTAVGSAATRPFRALRDLARPATVRPLPPAHPGCDTVTADYAGLLRRALGDLDDTVSVLSDDLDTIAARGGFGDLAGSSVKPFVFPWDTSHFDGADDPDSTGSAAGADTLDAAADDDDPIRVQDARTDQLYPQMEPIARVLRVHGEVLAAHARYVELRDAFREDRSEHQLAAAAMVADCRERVDALRPLLLEWRDAHDDYEHARGQAAVAEDSYAQALRAQPEQADEKFLRFLQSKAEASTSDPGARSQLNALLEQYRGAAADRAQTEVDADIATARLLAEDARCWAEQLHRTAEQARQRLEEAAGAGGVVEEADVHHMRHLADEIAMTEMFQAREHARRLPPYLNRARWAAAEDLQKNRSLTRDEALAEIDQITQTGFSFFDEATAPPLPTLDLRLPSFTDLPMDSHDDQGVDEDEVTLPIRADPIRQRPGAELAATIRALGSPYSRGLAVPTAPTSHVERVRDAHARLDRQATAITAAQRALVAADAQPEQPGLHQIAEQAIESAAAIGAPPHRWALLLARAADAETRAAEHARAERDDERDRQLRERSGARAARAADELAQALIEQRRRRTLAPVEAQAERLARATGPLDSPIHQADELGAPTPAVAPAAESAETGPGI